MLATIDVGSNTTRMLVGRCTSHRIQPEKYYRKITRLGGSFSETDGLAAESMERTLLALEGFSQVLACLPVDRLRIVGTAALRRAKNQQQFVAMLRQRTGLCLEIISGEEEAQLTAAGVLSVLDSLPEAALIIDIGGGSTELVFCRHGNVLLQRSFPLGVVRLCEEFPDPQARQSAISAMLAQFYCQLKKVVSPAESGRCQLIGTAGTITTLAALQLQMKDYDWRKINGHTLSSVWLCATRDLLQNMSVDERERLPGMEAGRGDLILPGMEVLLAIICRFGQQQIRVADAGLLEGAMLGLLCD